jgi:hypothetical protein
LDKARVTSVDESKLAWWQRMQERHQRSGSDEPPLKGGDGDGTSTPVEERVAKLEAYMEVSRDDLREIRTDMKAVLAKFGTIPTKADLNTWKWQWLAASVAIFAVIIASILGGLAWLDPH